MTVDLSQSDVELILELLDRELREAHSEIRRTETSVYRDDLKSHEKLAVGLRGRLKAALSETV